MSDPPKAPPDELVAPLLDDAVRVSSFAAMAAPENRRHYDDHFIRQYVCPMMGLDPQLATHEVIKVNRGAVGSRRAIPKALTQRLEGGGAVPRLQEALERREAQLLKLIHTLTELAQAEHADGTKALDIRSALFAQTADVFTSLQSSVGTFDAGKQPIHLAEVYAKLLPTPDAEAATVQ